MPVRQRVGQIVAHSAVIHTSASNDLKKPISQRSQELRIAQTTLWRILLENLGLHPYKIMLTQDMKPMDYSAHDAIGLLKRKFGWCIMSGSGPVYWLPRWSDLPPIDFSLLLRQIIASCQQCHVNVGRNQSESTAPNETAVAIWTKLSSINKCFDCTSSR